MTVLALILLAVIIALIIKIYYMKKAVREIGQSFEEKLKMRPIPSLTFQAATGRCAVWPAPSMNSLSSCAASATAMSRGTGK